MVSFFDQAQNLWFLGQFGSRRKGGEDHAAARYIFTKLSPLARKLYPEVDDNLYTYCVDDNQRVEPKFYAPIIPMALVNGSAGIAVGMATNIPPHNAAELCESQQWLGGTATATAGGFEAASIDWTVNQEE